MRQLRSQQDKGGFAMAIHLAERLVGSSVSGGRRAWFRTVIVGLGLVGILVYFIALANAGLFEEFNPDDTTNMYRAWTASASHLIRTATLDFWEGELRPVGFLFYKCIHYLFGFWSFPFRAASFVFIIANLILQFILYTRVFQKGEFAMLALLAGCFHGALWSIYASTGTIFDILCLFFLLLALNSYIGYVHRPRSWLLVLTYLSTIWAIQSKEMGYAAPVLLLCYEICLAIPAAGPPYGPSCRKALLRIAPTAVFAGIGTIGMLVGSDVMFRLPGYTPSLSWFTYAETNAAHLTMLFFREWKVSPAAGFLVLSGSLLLAAAIRSRAAVFGWLFYNAALLPISFVPARSDGYVLYAAYPGCAIYVASVVQFIAEHLSRFFAVRWRPRVSVASALLFAILVAHIQQIQGAGHLKRGFAPGGQSLVSDLASTAGLPGAAGKRRVILVNDPFGDDKWQPMFILRLSRNDMNLDVLRTNSAQLIAGAIPDVQPSDQVLIYSDHHYWEASAAELRSFATNTTGP